MDAAKVTLSDAEIGLLCNADLILTKNHILLQTMRLLQGLQEQLQEAVATQWPGQPLFDTLPKISRGENYLGLPWIVLDYPRKFGNPDICAVRSFFWWGRFYSSTLHLAGSWQQLWGPRLATAHHQLAAGHYYIQTGPDPWAHHFDTDNYTPISQLDPARFAHLLQRQVPIKIAAKWPLDQWHLAANNLSGSWELLLRICMG